MIKQSTRLIVKNLPLSHNDEEKVKGIFKKFGTITDVSLKFTSSGLYRRFAFVGFNDEKSCKEAILKINSTFVEGYKLLVEECQNFNSENKPRPWSKHTRGTSAYKRLHPGDQKVSEVLLTSTVCDMPDLKKAKIEPKVRKSDKKNPSDNKIESKFDKIRSNENNAKEDVCLNEIDDKILDTGRLFVRNLPYICTEDELRILFEQFGTLSEVQCIVDKKIGKCKGFGIITFMFPEHALTAYKELDATIFKGRILHILAGEEKNDQDEGAIIGDFALSEFQKAKSKKLKKEAKTATSTWNILFLGSNAVADELSEKFEIEKRHLLLDEGESSAAIRMAMAETKLVKETRDFFINNGVRLDAFSRPASERSKQVIIVKNLPAKTTEAVLMNKFSKFGQVERIIMPPERGISAIVVMASEFDAKRAFSKMAYFQIRNQPLYLEWAPFDILDLEKYSANTQPQIEEKTSDNKKVNGLEDFGYKNENAETNVDASTDVSGQKGRMKILVRNVPFQATLKEIRQLFITFGEIKFVRMPKKPGTVNEHRGFCFVEFISVKDAKRAFEALVHSTHLYGRRLVLEWAKREETTDEIMEKSAKKLAFCKKPKTKPAKKQIQESIEKLHSKSVF